MSKGLRLKGGTVLVDKSAQRGLTLVELIIVLAIVAIVGAILAPNFMTSTDKARLKSDIQSAKVIYNAICLYDAEQSVPTAKTSMAVTLKALRDQGYLTTGEGDIQTPLAKWVYSPAENGEDAVLVDVSACEDKIKIDTYNKLGNQEMKYIRGGVPNRAE